MKKSIILLALCFILISAAAVSAQEAQKIPEEAEVEVIIPYFFTQEPAEEAAVEPAEAEVSVEAAEPEKYTVTYFKNNCLDEVPADCNSYAAGTEVKVLFEPVKYRDYKIFYGWDINDDGIADFGYKFNKFTMPAGDVRLKAICITPSQGSGYSRSCRPHGGYPYFGLRQFDIVPIGSVRR